MSFKNVFKIYLNSFLNKKVDKAQGGGNANKNVVTDANGNITTEAKTTGPTASASTPNADTTSGAIGTSTNYARADHKHPKSTLYAEASHSHNYTTAETVDTKISTHNGSSVSHTDIRNSITGKADSNHTHGYLQNDGKIQRTNGTYSAGVVISSLDGTLTVADALTNTRLKDANAHSNIGTSANATQGDINTAIDTALGNKMNATNLATVATSGSYNDLSNKPTIPSDVSDLTDNSNTQFTPKAHTQTLSTITDADTVEVLVTYTDNTTETLDLVVWGGATIVTNVVLTQNGNTFTATVTNTKGNGISGKTVTLYMTYTSIAKSTSNTISTNNNGVATYTYPVLYPPMDGELEFKAVCDGIESNIISLV